MTLKTDTIVDAALIAAPSSTKNVEKKRDPDMHQTRKGQQWYFGMKLHTLAWTVKAAWRTAPWSPRPTYMDKTTVEFYQSTLPWFSQECRSRICRAGIGEYLLFSKSIDGTGTPMTGKWRAKNPRSSQKWQS